MTHAEAQAAIHRLFSGAPPRGGALRAHLDECETCRGFFDRTAHAFRVLSGKPDEMTPEELSFFSPPLPVARSVLLRGPVVGSLVALAATLMVLLWPQPAEFTARGGERAAARSTVRALCWHDEGQGPVVGEATAGHCRAGDRLGFVASPGAGRFMAVALVDASGAVEVVASGTSAAVGTEEAVLPEASTWRAGLRGVVVTADAPVSAEQAAACARGTCAGGLDVQPLALEKPR